MILQVDGLQSSLIDMRVNLSGGDIAVAQEFLNDAEVGSSAQEVSGEAMAQRMR